MAWNSIGMSRVAVNYALHAEIGYRNQFYPGNPSILPPYWRLHLGWAAPQSCQRPHLKWPLHPLRKIKGRCFCTGWISGSSNFACAVRILALHVVIHTWRAQSRLRPKSEKPSLRPGNIRPLTQLVGLLSYVSSCLILLNHITSLFIAELKVGNPFVQFF